MAVKINKGQALGSLSLTPLIDVVFLLLIFFLVATRFAQEDRELEVVLPSASVAQPLIAAPKEVFVNIDQNGKFYIEGTFMTTDEVGEALERAAVNNPVNQSVVIRADKRVQFDFVVAVMNACNEVGITDYTVTTAGQN